VLSRAELAELDHGYESDSEQEAEYAADRTHGHSHSHAHRQLRSSSMPTHPTKELSGSVKLHRQQQVNVRAAFIHVLGDLVQSVGVMIAGLVIWLRPQWHIADPICTLLFAVLVIATTWNILQEVVNAH
jgi:zinc transporter 2